MTQLQTEKIIGHLEEAVTMLRRGLETWSPADTPLEQMGGMTPMILTALTAQGVKTAGDLARLTESDLLRCYSIGPAKIVQIRASLAFLGLSLAPEC